MQIKQGNFFRLFSLLWTEYGNFRLSIITLSILSCVGGFLEGVGITSIIPLFSFVNRSSDRGTDTISQIIEKFFLFLHLQYTLKALLLFIVILFFLKATISFVTTYIAARITTTYEKKTRGELFDLTLRADWPFLSRQKVGHLEQALSTDVNYSSNLLANISSTILILANLFVYILVAVNISYLIATLTLILGGVLFLLLKPLFYRSRFFSGQIEKMYKRMAHFINENTIGMKTLKSTAVEEAIKERAKEQFDEICRLNMRTNSVRNLSNAMLQPVGLVFIIAMFSFFYKMTDFNFASFAVIVYAINKVFAYIQMAQVQFHAMSSIFPYVASIVQYRMETQEHREKDSGVRDFRFYDTLQFSTVNFSYNHDSPVLSNVTFTIKKGEMVGFIGPSGAGKTTIVDLLLRLLEPQSGVITADGESIASVRLKDWRSHIGYVSQDMFLINDTIGNNIKFYNPNITDDEMVAAAKMANIYEFVKRQPLQFNTVIGERGIFISGGEKQRVILARILARRPEIIVLDEATSALDNESEVLIQQAIEQLKKQCTVIVIAHRLSTIMTADRLVALEGGKIKEQGKPSELLQDKDSYFFRVYNVR